MKFDIDKVRAAIKDAPRKVSTREAPVRDAVASMYDDLADLLNNKKYTYKEAAALLSENGFSITANTLKSYLAKIAKEDRNEAAPGSRKARSIHKKS